MHAILAKRQASSLPAAAAATATALQPAQVRSLVGRHCLILLLQQQVAGFPTKFLHHVYMRILRMTTCCALFWLGCRCQGCRKHPALGRVSVLCSRFECRGCGAGAGAAGGRRAAAGYAPGRRYARSRVSAAPAAVQVTAHVYIGSFMAR